LPSFFLSPKSHRPEEFVKLNQPGLKTAPKRVALSAVLPAVIAVSALWLAGSPRILPGTAPGPIAATMPVRDFSSSAVRASFAEMPLAFERNQGQTDSRVRFLSRGSGYTLFLTGKSAVIEVQVPISSHQNAHAANSAVTGKTVTMSLANANSNAQINGDGLLPGKSNYLIGNDPAKWHRNIAQFSRVRYRQVYPGIDLVYYGKQGRLEHDFRVAPGADPRAVVLDFAGDCKLRLSKSGDLLLDGDDESLRVQAPSIYQKSADRQETVAGKFVLLGRNRVGFQIGRYDRSRELIIDPVLSYSTYLGGSGTESFPTIAVDSSFNFYVSGSTTSADFPIAGGISPNHLSGAANIFVTKFNPTGAAPLVFSTYLGGTGTDTSAGIAVDSALNVYVAGTTTSPDFPTTATAFQATPTNSSDHIFVSQINAGGTGLLYSTYLSGTGSDVATGLAIDNKLDAFVTGTTTSADFPVSVSPAPFQSKPQTGATSQFFASEINTTLSGTASLAYSTYFGGGNPSNGLTQGGGIAVDASGNFYITGGTNFLHTGASNDFPILNAYQDCLDVSPPIPPPIVPPPCPTTVTASDAFIAKLNPTAAQGSQLVYSTYIGGAGDDIGNGIAVDGNANAYITGSTTSTDVILPTTVTAFQTTNKGGTDAFLAKVGNPTTTTSTIFPMNYFSYLGGTGTDIGLALAVDTSQAVHLSGSTTSSDFNLTNAFQTTFGGVSDAFVAVLPTATNVGTGTQGEYSSYLGGGSTDRGTGVAVDPNGVTYVTGETMSGNFPVVAPFQGGLKGAQNAFVSKISSVSAVTISGTVSPSPVGLGNQATFTYTIKNSGPDTASNVLFSDQLPITGATFNSITASPGSCVTTPVNGLVTCTIGTLEPNSTSSATVTVVLTPTVASTLVNVGCLSVNGGTSCGLSSTNTVPVTDFTVAASPNSATVTAGQPASFNVTVTPQPTYTAQVSLSCSSGLPTGASCSFTTTPLTIPSTGAVSSTMVINTTARVTTTTQLRKWLGGSAYATWFPISGLALLGAGLGRTGFGRKKKRGIEIGLLAALFALLLFLPSCGTTKTTTTTTGTPAGTYIVTVSGTSGSASHTSTLTLIVQ